MLWQVCPVWWGEQRDVHCVAPGAEAARGEVHPAPLLLTGAHSPSLQNPLHTSHCSLSHTLCSTLSLKWWPLCIFQVQFLQYMDENLTDGGEGGRSGRPGGLIRTTSSSSIPQIKRWIRTPKAIIMHLTNGTIQVQYITYQSHPPSWGASAALSPISCGRACLPPFPYWSINIDPQSHITDLLHLHGFHNTNDSTSLSSRWTTSRTTPSWLWAGRGNLLWLTSTPRGKAGAGAFLTWPGEAHCPRLDLTQYWGFWCPIKNSSKLPDVTPACNKTPEYWVQFLPDLNPCHG